MNLRSGDTKPEQVKAKNKRKRKPRPNTMAGEQTEGTATDLKSLMLIIKDELGAFRADFNKNSAETRSEIEKLTTEVKGMQAEISRTNGEIVAAQLRISELEDKEPIKNEVLTHLLVQQTLMADKLEYLENKSRQNNIRIHQVKEESEGEDIVKFLDELISEKLDIPENELFIVAAHRSPRNKPKDGEPPRSIVVRFLTWQTKQKVLQAAWEKKRAPIMYAEERIYFDQDYSATVMKKRGQYTWIRKELRGKEIKSHFMYPAKLKVFTKGGVQVFNNATEASRALQAQNIIGAHSRAYDGQQVRPGGQTVPGVGLRPTSDAPQRGKMLLEDKTVELLKKLTGKDGDWWT